MRYRSESNLCHRAFMAQQCANRNKYHNMTETKLLQDFIALAKTGSFTKAAELRHVTHPAFSRRIKELETWAGAPLINRKNIPISLNEAGHDLLVVAEHIIARLNTVRQQISKPEDQADRKLRIATGRNLAHYLVADWASDLSHQVAKNMGCAVSIEIRTGITQDMIALMTQGQADFLCCYEHHSLSVPISTKDFLYVSLSTDKLVPVCLNTPNGTGPAYRLEDEISPIAHITYFASLSLQHIINDHLRSSSYHLEEIASCDSVDVALSLVKKQLGIAWLPWSVVRRDCEAGILKVLGNRNNEIPYEVRLYRPKSSLSTAAELAWKKTVA